MKPRVIAINLPQFHPFQENDEWWGKGFTEWTNVTKAKPRFIGHYQPHLPTDTGFYDLRLPEARQMQADMAREYGIYGFCYYHYWFNGHRLMERPVNEILSSGKPDFPFMLCWANENWTRNWDGGYSTILKEQKYCEEDDIEHMTYLCTQVFNDKRYIRIDNKPVFVIYKPKLFPNMEKTIKTWRKVASDYGMELYLIGARKVDVTTETILSMGFDASIDFQPVTLGPYRKKNFYWRNIPLRLNKIFFGKRLVCSQYVHYPSYVKYKIQTYETDTKKCYPCVSPGWDNSPRRVGKRFTVFVGSTPEWFYKWFAAIYSKFVPWSTEENLIFINAWNEWAEGNHLEPDRKWGRKYLEAVRKVINGLS